MALHQQPMHPPSVKAVLLYYARMLFCVLVGGPASILFVAIVLGSSLSFTNLAEVTYAALYEQSATAPYRCLDRLSDDAQIGVKSLDRPGLESLGRPIPDCENKQFISRQEAIAVGATLFQVLYAVLVLISGWIWYAFALRSPLQLRQRLADAVAAKLSDGAKRLRTRLSQR
jgi:hypothetical protein